VDLSKLSGSVGCTTAYLEKCSLPAAVQKSAWGKSSNPSNQACAYGYLEKLLDIDYRQQIAVVACVSAWRRHKILRTRVSQ
jgi:hypothetical protein